MTYCRICPLMFLIMDNKPSTCCPSLARLSVCLLQPVNYVWMSRMSPLQQKSLRPMKNSLQGIPQSLWSLASRNVSDSTVVE